MVIDDALVGDFLHGIAAVQMGAAYQQAGVAQLLQHLLHAAVSALGQVRNRSMLIAESVVLGLQMTWRRLARL